MTAVCNSVYVYTWFYPLIMSSFVWLYVGGGRFMADLLVTSMMADGGLEAAFEASLQGKRCKFHLRNIF